MSAPQIKNDAGASALDAPGRRKLDGLFALLDRFEAVGDDNLHVLWLRADRGPVEAFGDVEEWLEEGLGGTDVPDNIIPRCCESFLPGESIAGCMNLPRVHWLPLETLRLKPAV